MAPSSTPREYNPYLGKELSTLLILSTLKAKKNSSTYDLIKDIKEITDNKISFRAGTIYPLMVKLETENILLKSIEDTPSRSAGVTRQKSVYSLSKKGLKFLKEKEKDWYDLVIIINQILAK